MVGIAWLETPPAGMVTVAAVPARLQAVRVPALAMLQPTMFQLAVRFSVTLSEPVRTWIGGEQAPPCTVTDWLCVLAPVTLWAPTVKLKVSLRSTKCSHGGETTACLHISRYPLLASATLLTLV